MRIFNRRIWLLILLVLWLFATIPLITSLPSGGARNSWIDTPSQQAVFEFSSYRARSLSRPWSRVVSLDLNTGKLNRLPIDERSLGQSFHTNDGRLLWTSYPDGLPMQTKGSPNKPPPSNHVHITTFDLATGQSKRSMPLERLDGFPISDRYYVHITDQSVSILDLDNVEVGQRVLPDVVTASDAAIIPDSDRFLLVNPRYVSDPVDSREHRLALFRCDENNGVTKLSDWPIASRGLTFRILTDAEVISASVDGQFLEFRSGLDGSLIRQEPVPAGVLHGIETQENLPSRILQTSINSRRAFDIETMQWLPSPGPEYWIEDESPDHRRLLDRDDKHFANFVVLDRHAQTELSQFTIDFGSHARFIDADRIAVMSYGYGITVRVIDVTTGATLKLYQPYYWLVPWLAVMVVVYVVWAAMFWINTLRERRSKLTCFALVILMPLAVLIVRQWWSGML